MESNARWSIMDHVPGKCENWRDAFLRAWGYTCCVCGSAASQYRDGLEERTCFPCFMWAVQEVAGIEERRMSVKLALQEFPRWCKGS